MRRIVVFTMISLDGVMQAPGGPDEDRTGDFKLGGWLPKVGDDAVGERVDKLFTPPFDLLLGRRTYDIFAAYWPYATGERKSIGRAVRPRRENMWRSEGTNALIGRTAIASKASTPSLR